MTRYRVIWLLLLATIVGALSSGRSLWWSFAGALFSLIVVSLIWSWVSINWIRLRRRTLTRVAQAGQTLEEQFVLHNLSIVPKLWLEVRDFSTLPDHSASRVIGLIPGKQWRGWRVQTICRERGRFVLGPVVVRSGDPLGIYQMERAIERAHTILVHPATEDFREFPLPLGYLPGGDTHRRRTHYVTTNASGVRDYMTGDGINRIHWPISIKRQRLTVKEFELDPLSDLWILLDLQREVHVEAEALSDTDNALAPTSRPFVLPASTQEYAISIAASIIKHFLRQDRPVGLIAYGRHREAFAAERGERQYDKLMEVLSVVRAEGEVPFHRVLRAESPALSRGATVIAISPSADLSWSAMAQHMTRAGLRMMAIVVDAHSFGASQSCAPLVGALAQAGVVVRVVRRGDSLATAIEQPATLAASA
ncbi:MAG: DUF58 domain-containing protein [Anaerolineae bacterium]|nr:DUF58 domain-containing protein [Thermoflexales bacterium]MDW8408811.1 DUF58 domain-containing protein [Anaerolineae bacterium]